MRRYQAAAYPHRVAEKLYNGKGILEPLDIRS
jgi:hypothetical protein